MSRLSNSIWNLQTINLWIITNLRIPPPKEAMMTLPLSLFAQVLKNVSTTFICLSYDDEPNILFVFIIFNLLKHSTNICTPHNSKLQISIKYSCLYFFCFEFKFVIINNQRKSCNSVQHLTLL